MKQKSKLLIHCFSYCVIAAVILLGTIVFRNRLYAFVSAVVAVFSIVPIFIKFEKKQHNTTLLILMAALVALSAGGRIIFMPLQFFKPVTAVIIITAMYFGSEVGFMTGALSAVISNFYFGQGPWTPFQMITWGLIGFFAGLFAAKLKQSKIILSLFGAFSGVVFSLFMDMWSVIWTDGVFNPERFAAYVISSIIPMTVYAVSNIVFLIALAKPLGTKLDRVKQKYGI